MLVFPRHIFLHERRVWLLCALLPSWVACMVQSDLTFEHVLARLYCCASSIFLPFQHSLVTASGAQFPALLSFKLSLGNPCTLNCAQLFAHLGPSRLRRLSRHFDDFQNAASLKSILGRRTSITPTFKVGALQCASKELFFMSFICICTNHWKSRAASVVASSIMPKKQPLPF